MQSTSDTSDRGTNHLANGQPQPTKVTNGVHNNSHTDQSPRYLSAAAIKLLQENHEQKHHSNLNYILQIVRVRDLLEGKTPTAGAGAAAAGRARAARDGRDHREIAAAEPAVLGEPRRAPPGSHGGNRWLRAALHPPKRPPSPWACCQALGCRLSTGATSPISHASEAQADPHAVVRYRDDLVVVGVLATLCAQA